MLLLVKISILWAIMALLFQLIISWGGGKKDYSVKVGNYLKAIIYNFTIALTPKHKETISNHPIKFTLGIIMHLGVFLALIKVFLLLLSVEMQGLIIIIIFLLASVSTLILFFRRIINSEMRCLSSLEDYFSNLITLGLIFFSLLHEYSLITSSVFLIYVSIFFFYLPIGKLRHALFFFVARFNYAQRLGHRNIYPTSSES